MEEKIKSINELSEICRNLKSLGKKVVLCHGCFDLLHYGHIQHFMSSKKEGDVLIVTVTPDIFVKKGPERPFFNQDIRLRHIAALQFVDYVGLNEWETAIETIKLIKPDVYSKGREVLGNASIDEVMNGTCKQSNLSFEIETLKSFGGRMHFTDDATFSSSRIINQITAAIPDETKEYLREFKKNHSIDSILDVLKSLENTRVLVIGDAILDEYIYALPLRMTGKEALVAYKFLNSNLHLGGVFAFANNVANFSKNTAVLTCVGENIYEFIHNSLNSSIESNIFIQQGYKTMTKTRYINDDRKNKVFEVYSDGIFKISCESEEKILRYLEKNLNRFDVVIISDFGHGFFTPKIINFLNGSGKFLSINCQSNAGNWGFNYLTKYSNGDFASANENEIRLPLQDREGDIKELIKKICEKTNIKRLNATLGKRGSLYFANNEFYKGYSFTQEIIDTIGAGDAVHGLTSLIAHKNAAPELVPFLGNCIGALAVKIMGNEKTVDPIELRKFVSYILK